MQLGLTADFADNLQAYSTKTKTEIESICDDNYETLLGSLSSVANIRSSISALAREVESINEVICSLNCCSLRYLFSLLEIAVSPCDVFTCTPRNLLPTDQNSRH